MPPAEFAVFSCEGAEQSDKFNNYNILLCLLRVLEEVGERSVREPFSRQVRVSPQRTSLPLALNSFIWIGLA